MAKKAKTIAILPVKGFDVGVDKTNRRFLVRFHAGKEATPYISLSASDAGDLSAEISRRLSKLVAMH